jgi:hypothetical protein
MPTTFSNHFTVIIFLMRWMGLLKWYLFLNDSPKVTSIINIRTTRSEGSTSSASWPLSSRLGNPTAPRGWYSLLREPLFWSLLRSQDKSALRKSYSPKCYGETFNRTGMLCRKENILVSRDEANDAIGRKISNVCGVCFAQSLPNNACVSSKFRELRGQ